jgi:SP family sugar:H+ symporter-like MFS transporter
MQIVFALILGGGMFFLPESPRHLVRIGQLEKAKASLSFLHGLHADHAVVAQEFDEIEMSLRIEREHGAGYLDCWKAPYLKRQFAGCALQALQQLTGSKSMLTPREISYT